MWTDEEVAELKAAVPGEWENLFSPRGAINLAGTDVFASVVGPGEKFLCCGEVSARCSTWEEARVELTEALERKGTVAVHETERQEARAKVLLEGLAVLEGKNLEQDRLMRAIEEANHAIRRVQELAPEMVNVEIGSSYRLVESVLCDTRRGLVLTLQKPEKKPKASVSAKRLSKSDLDRLRLMVSSADSRPESRRVRFHKDGTVTLWDVLAKVWRRMPAEVAWLCRNGPSLEAMSTADRERLRLMVFSPDERAARFADALIASPDTRPKSRRQARALAEDWAKMDGAPRGSYAGYADAWCDAWDV